MIRIAGSHARLILVAVPSLAAAVALAQSRTAARPAAATHGTASAHGGAVAQTERVKIRKVMGLGRDDIMRTPQYNTDVSRYRNTSQEWLRVGVAFDTAPEWIDEMMVRYYVLLMRMEQGKRVHTMFKGSVTHVDVERGRGHWSGMFLRPSGLKRYGDCVAVAVEIVENGQVVASERDEKAKYPDKWWETTENVVIKDGYLLPVNRTPFAASNYDDYEDVK